MSASEALATLSQEIGLIEADRSRLISENESLRSDVISLNSRITALEKAISAPAPVVTPQPPTPTAPDSTPEAGVTFVPKNMVQCADGIWRSISDPLNCYLQWRTPRPIKWVQIKVKRRTNIIPSNTSTNGINLKVLRDGPGYANTYVGVGTKQGAWKMTTEHVAPKSATNDGKWPVLPYVSGEWIDETWELNYEAGTFAHKVGARSWSGSFDPGGVTRTYIGVQTFVATDPKPIGLPANPFTEFEVVSFEWK